MRTLARTIQRARLQGYWQLNGNGIDLTPNLWNLSGTAPTYYPVPDTNVVAAKFNGSTQYLNSPVFGGGADWSCTFWYCPNSISTGQYVVSKDDVSTKRIFGFYHDNTNGMTLYAWGTGQAFHQTTTTASGMKTGTWYKWTAVWDSANNLVTLYRNGKSFTSFTLTGNQAADQTANNLTIGRQNAGTPGLYLNGWVREVVLVHRPMSPKEVYDDYILSQLAPIRRQFYIAAGNNFTQTLSDSFSLSELFTKQPGKSLIDTLSLSETLAKVLTAFRTFTDTITISEAFASAKQNFRTYTDSITLSEAFIKLPGKVLADSVSLAEQFIKQAYKAISDALTLSEAFTAVKTKVQTLIDTFSLSEFFSKLTGKQATDSITLTEQFTKTVQRTFTEAQITLAEAYSSVKTKVQTFVETFSLSDTITKVKNAVKSLTDTISITEAFATLKNFVRTLTDSISLSETLTTVKSKLQSLADSLTLTETFTAVKNAVKSFSESLSLTETFSAAKSAFRTFAETLSLTEAFTALKTAYRNFTESFSLTDTLAKLTRKAFNEVVSISETIAKYKNGVLVFWQARIKGALTFAKRIKPTFTWGTRTKPSNSFWTKRNRP